MATTKFRNDMEITGNLTVDGTITSGGTDTVASGERVAHIADPTGGTTTDTEARAAIASIIDALEAFKIAASA